MLKIGITYDLRDDYKDCGLSAEEISEFDSTDTINSLANAIGVCLKSNFYLNIYQKIRTYQYYNEFGLNFVRNSSIF
ncbi:MAG: hypothetical protein ISQ34_02595 [Rickettsiales bacterium]|nr:hypothetical protein [Rickettsiales bacterium]